MICFVCVFKLCLILYCLLFVDVHCLCMLFCSNLKARTRRFFVARPLNPLGVPQPSEGPGAVPSQGGTCNVFWCLVSFVCLKVTCWPVGRFFCETCAIGEKVPCQTPL